MRILKDVKGGGRLLAVLGVFGKNAQGFKSQKDAKSNIERLALDEEAKAFVKKYGAYLQLHSCLSYSAVVKAEAPIGDLLIAASHDPTHRDATKEIQRANALIFYDEVSNAQCGLSD